MRTGFLLFLFANIVVYSQQYYQQPAYPNNPMDNVQPQPQPQSQPTEQCTAGACCSETKTFLPAGEPCRATTNPCEEMARCNGQSAQCPENPKKANGVSCLSNGKCTDGFCVEYDCAGLCCQDGKMAADGTACGTEGKCEKGTCTVYKEVDPHVKKLSEEEQEVIKKAQKQVKGELEELLRAHARYIKNREAFKKIANLTAAQKFESAIGLTNVTGHNQDALLAGNTNSTIGLSTGGILIICGLALIVIAVLIIFVIKPKERASSKESKPKAAKKKSHGDDMTSTNYEPPAF